jgi:hypothetical protein
MTMTNLPERLLRPWRRTLLASLLALLAACGPGTGGTGVGPISFSGASAVTGAAAGAIVAPPAPAGLPCSTCTPAELQLQQEQVELRVPCGRFVAAGPWDPEASELVLAGTFTLTRADGPASAPATLRLQFGPAGVASQQVIVTLVDAAGAPLVLAVLQRGEAAAAPVQTCAP